MLFNNGVPADIGTGSGGPPFSVLSLYATAPDLDGVATSVTITAFAAGVQVHLTLVAHMELQLVCTNHDRLTFSTDILIVCPALLNDSMMCYTCQVGTLTSTISRKFATPVTFDASFSNIDQLVFSDNGSSQHGAILDDLCVTPPPKPPPPFPPPAPPAGLIKADINLGKLVPVSWCNAKPRTKHVIFPLGL